ncbi:uncharacterized protein LOC129601898 [Paramacrobiotus metropolitanus]|uniref:uncharacterized protein LOC129601898 n=1 Tax=Paramacrobiotus metropolitanus TaxID=2943436 RepID=UPI00244592E7|nr:uncharacterized protein LOC129601898 [Paramacrobiotus metropolitanus]XP_055356802.1 uncharacterized protein LOC129601898 [Paramacrobiotus metropolitanus]
MASIYAGAFQQQLSPANFRRYRVTLKTTANEKTDLHLCGSQADLQFENSGFKHLATMKFALPTAAELTVRTTSGSDSRTDFQQLRTDLLPLVKLFVDGIKSDAVQCYYGIDYTFPKPSAQRNFYILAEDCAGVPLDEHMKTKSVPVSENEVIVFARQILEGLRFLHGHQIIHRDIKGENLIIMAATKTLKIIGLTMIKHFDGTQTPPSTLRNAAGTVPFVSPEMAALSAGLQSQPSYVGRKTDIWSFGCVVIQMMQKGQPPVFARTDKDVIKPNAMSDSFQSVHRYFGHGYRPQQPKTFAGSSVDISSEFLSLLNGCLAVDVSERSSASELLDMLLTSYYYLFCPRRPKFVGAEEQRFHAERYSLLPVQVNTDGNSVLPQQQAVTLTDVEQQERRQYDLLKKVTLPEMAKGTMTCDCDVTIVSSRSTGDSDYEIVFANKKRMYEMLIKDVARRTKHIIQHLHVTSVLCDNLLEIHVFTEHGDAYERLSDCLSSRQSFEKSFIPNITRQILEGLRILHRHNIVHKDIRCFNVLKRKTEHLKDRCLLKITGFEKAAYHNFDSNMGNFVSYPEGSAQFASKEMQELLSFSPSGQKDNVGTATDIFSLGCTVIEMYQRGIAPAWVSKKNGKTHEFGSTSGLAGFVRNLAQLTETDAQPDYSRILFDNAGGLNFVQSCFVQPSTNRPTCDSLQFHPFIVNEVGPDASVLTTLQRKTEDELSPIMLKSSQYTKTMPIGAGAIGKVYKASTANGTNVAIKIIEKNRSLNPKSPGNTEEDAEASNPRMSGVTEVYAESFRRFEVLLELQHENIVSYFSYSISRDIEKVTTSHTMDYCDGGDLEFLLIEIKENGGRLQWRTAFQYAIEITEGLSYLHKCEIVHGDLKPKHVLMKHLANGHMKMLIGDLDDFIEIGGHAASSGGIGTYQYMSPELLRERLGLSDKMQTIGTKSDIWSMGYIILRLALFIEGQYEIKLHPACHSPESVGDNIHSDHKKKVNEVSDLYIVKKIMDRDSDYISSVLSSIPLRTEAWKQAAICLGRCLDYDPEKRMAATDLSDELRSLKDALL